MESEQFDREALTGGAVDEAQTQETLKSIYQQGYTSEPHAAVAYHGLHQSLKSGETGIFLGTAHPAKFKGTVEDILKISLPLPQELADCVDKPDLAHLLPADFDELRQFLLAL